MKEEKGVERLGLTWRIRDGEGYRRLSGNENPRREAVNRKRK